MTSLVEDYQKEGTTSFVKRVHLSLLSVHLLFSPITTVIVNMTQLHVEVRLKDADDGEYIARAEVSLFQC